MNNLATKSELLRNLKGTAEGLLAIGTYNVWNTCGGWDRIQMSVQNILTHHLIPREDFWRNGFWPVIESATALGYLNPPNFDVMRANFEDTNASFATPRSSMGAGMQNCQRWLRDALREHRITCLLRQLTSHPDFLSAFYEADAFLLDTTFVSVMLICLTAVEHNSSFLLADINPVLYPLIYKAATTTTGCPSHHGPGSASGSNSVGKSVSRTQSLHASDGRLQPSSQSGRASRARSLQFEFDRVSSSSSSGHQRGDATSSDDDDAEDEGGRENGPSLRQMSQASSPDEARSHSTTTRTPPVARRNFQEEKEERDEEEGIILDDDLDDADEADSNDDASSTDTFLNGVTSLSIRGRRRTGSRANSGSDTLSVHTLVACEDAALEDFKNAFSRKGKKEDMDETLRETRSEDEEGDRDGAMERDREGSLNSPQPPQRSASLPAISLMPQDQPIVTGEESVDNCRRESLPHGFSRPKEGESLLRFLAAQDTCTCAELDKENAHFAICEALIAAFEQMRCNAGVSDAQGGGDEDNGGRITNDPEIKALNMKIEKRKMELERSNRIVQHEGFTDCDTVTTGSPLSSVHSSSAFSDLSSSDYSSEDEANSRSRFRNRVSNGPALQQQQQRQQLPSLLAYDSSSSSAFGSAPSVDRISISHSGSSLGLVNASESIATSVSANWNSTGAPAESFSSSTVSAEVVALNLLRKFSEHQLPKASELEWMVSEEECSQALLPLPDSIAVAPDEVEKGIATRIRGNLEWAPPRQQIVFNINTPDKPKIQIAKQNYRCAGCGAKVEIAYVKRLRFCHYLGKFFCACCHSNETYVIPARILHKWDFNKYPVSNFSKDTLNKVYEEPLFNVHDTNPRLYRKFRILNDVRVLRQQLYYIHKYISTCRFADKELAKLRNLPSHLYNEIDFYSIKDFLDIKITDFPKHIKTIVADCTSHCAKCELCLARGHVCEICNSVNDILFPWKPNVFQCGSCHACFHMKCFEKNPPNQRSETGTCPKCYRLGKRKTETLQSA